MLRAYLLAVLIQMVAVNALSELGVLSVVIPPFYGVETALGGLVFGLGMFLAMGCAGAILYRAGEGRIDYLVALVAYAIGTWASSNWLVPGFRTAFAISGATLTLHTALTADRWLVVAILIIVGLSWVLRGKRHPYFGGWDWARTGMFLGLIGISAWADSALAGQPTGFGTMAGTRDFTEVISNGDLSRINWSIFLVIGIPAGSFIAARSTGPIRSLPIRSERIIQAICGGLCMGIGASLAGGDNIFHGLSGIPLLAVSSFVFMVFAFVGVWLGVLAERVTKARIVMWPDAPDIEPT
jgi:uncharacterized membrane protein YedE/YeeE